MNKKLSMGQKLRLKARSMNKKIAGDNLRSEQFSTDDRPERWHEQSGNDWVVRGEIAFSNVGSILETG
jgi:hypothetical protein